MQKVDFYIMRRTKKIKLQDLAEYINCSVSLISLWENDKANMDIKKVRLYKEFIINK